MAAMRSQPRHTCHAAGCSIVIPPKLFMCRTHWFKLPQHLRNSIWAEYRPGQEIDKQASARYLLTAVWCICFVADKEGVVDHEHVRSEEAIEAGR